MSELTLPTVVSDTLWQPSSKVEIFDGTFDGCFDVVKCSFKNVKNDKADKDAWRRRAYLVVMCLVLNSTAFAGCFLIM